MGFCDLSPQITCITGDLAQPVSSILFLCFQKVCIHTGFFCIFLQASLCTILAYFNEPVTDIILVFGFISKGIISIGFLIPFTSCDLRDPVHAVTV